MRYPPSHETDRFTYGDYVKWPDEERWELIEGVAYDMTPAPSTQHQRISGRLLLAIGNFLKNKRCEVFPAPFDIRLPEGQEADEEITTVVQPDIAVICDPQKLDDAGCRGAPDFIIEILSPYTARKDLVRKAALYEKHGVREYWMVHPTDQFVILRVLGEDGRYGAPQIIEATGRIAVSALPGLEIGLDAVFAPKAAETDEGAPI